MRALRIPIAALACLTACLTEPPTLDELGEAAAELDGPGHTVARESIRVRTARTASCLVTKINATYAISSRRCALAVGATVTFYPPLPSDPAPTARVEEVIARPGTTASGCQQRSTCVDSLGLFGDLVLLRLSTDVALDTWGDPGVDALDTPVATMAWRFPGAVSGVQVGAGTNDVGQPMLDEIAETIDSSTEPYGWFETTHDYVDPLDRGGAFWVGDKVIGTLWGDGYDVGDGNWALYTSVPRHLDWILNRIKYAWAGLPPVTGLFYDGIYVDSFNATEQVCRYACEKTSNCQAYNYNLSTYQCSLMRDVTGAHLQSGRRGGLRYGAGTGKSGEIVGYVRNDAYNSVVHVGSNGSLRELWRHQNASTWSSGAITTITPNRPAIASKLSAYRRSDGVDAIVYRSTANRIIEVARTAQGWDWADLSSWIPPTGPQNRIPAGDPVGYVRGDGVNAVVYRSSLTNLVELRLGTKGWIGDILGTAGADPIPFVMPDGRSAVVTRTAPSNANAAEVRLFIKPPGEPWQSASITDLATEANGYGGPAPAPTGRVQGFVNRNGVTTLVYRTVANGTVELRKEGNVWKWENLSSPGAVTYYDPVAWVRADGVESIVFRSYTDDVREVTRPPLQHWNLSAQYGVFDLYKDPTVYVRNDGTSSILFGLYANHVGELMYDVGTGWSWTDLTWASGETP